MPQLERPIALRPRTSLFVRALRIALIATVVTALFVFALAIMVVATTS